MKEESHSGEATAQPKPLYHVDTKHGSVKVMSFADIKKKLVPKSDNNILLGNGFNMSIGIDTSYGNLGRDLIEACSDPRVLPYEHKDTEEEDFNLEKQITKLREKKDPCAGFVEKELCRIILEKSENVQENKVPIMKFLADFESVFTTNYDPVLYLVFIAIRDQGKKVKSLKEICPSSHDLDLLEEIREKIEEAKEEIVSVTKDKLEPIGEFTKPLASELIARLFRSRGEGEYTRAQIEAAWKEPDPKSEIEKAKAQPDPRDFLDKKHLGKHDGFLRDESKPPQWKRKKKQNLFYLHGAFHIYEDGSEIFKYTRKEAKSLHETLAAKEFSHVGVFQETKKKEKILANEYLEHCYTKLQNIQGPLCIIGWSCEQSDSHLADAIKSSPVESVLISVYSDKTENGKYKSNQGTVRTIENFLDQFDEVQIEFFEVQTIDYKIEP